MDRATPSYGGSAPTVAVDGWEGPLDLLLALARAQKVDLRELSVLALVDQYLLWVARARAGLELAADWLVTAAWLAYLKSALLLPRAPADEPDADELADRLRRRLMRLEAMRDAGAALMARDRLGRDRFARGRPEGLAVVPRPDWQASLHDLLAGYGRARRRTATVTHQVAGRPVVTLEQALERLAALVGGADWTALAAFLPAGLPPALRRSGLASAFAAALELARQGRVELAQAAPFAPLQLRGLP